MPNYTGQYNGIPASIDSNPSSDLPGVPGPQGPAGKDGKDGKDGVSPMISVKNVEGGHIVTITDISGEHSFNVMNGKDGERGQRGEPGQEGPKGADGLNGLNGTDGFSPTVDVQSIDGGHKVIITYESGQHDFDVMNGVDGQQGTDGVSPSVSIENVTGGHKVTITDKEGSKDFTVLDGKDVQIDATVDQTTGKATVSVTKESEKTILAFSGIKGETGATGPQGPKGDTAQTEEIYSLTETRIGTWIDGRPLYRNVLLLQLPSYTGYYEFSHPIDNLNTIVTWIAYLKTKATGSILIIPSVSIEGPYQISGYYNSAKNAWCFNIGMDVYTGTSVTVIEEYTKTTDPATIELPSNLFIDTLLPKTSTIASSAVELK